MHSPEKMTTVEASSSGSGHLEVVAETGDARNGRRGGGQPEDLYR